jgi:predicted nucleotide-binding protein
LEDNMDRAGIFDAGIKLAAIPAAADRDWVSSQSFKAHFDAWAERVGRRRDIFLGYCSKADSCATEIRDYLEKKGYVVLDWARDFRPAGATILEEIENAANRCRCAVFLFTKDDELGNKARAKASFDAIPRDNVLLEAGYFTQARGKERVAIIRETGAKMPADLGGIIYLSLEDRNRLLPVKRGLLKFLNAAL